MNLVWSESSWNDYLYWQKNDKTILMDIFQEELHQNID